MAEQVGVIPLMGSSVLYGSLVGVERDGKIAFVGLEYTS